MSFYGFIQKGLGGLARLLYRIRVSGNTESLKRLEEGGVLVCSNHTSMLDPVLIAMSFKPVIRFMAKKEIFRIPLLALFFKALNAFPVNRSGADVGAIRSATRLLKSGENVGVFPQGTRRKYVDPAETEVKNGVGMLSYRSGCDILPVFIKTSNNHVHLFGKTEIIVGNIINNEELCFEKGGTGEYEKASRLIFSKICTLGGYSFPLLKGSEDKSRLNSGYEAEHTSGNAEGETGGGK